MLHKILDAFGRTLLFVSVIWLCYFIQVVCAILGFNLVEFGLEPRSLTGSIGIFFMHFLHGNLVHITMNTIGLFMVLPPLYLAFENKLHVPETILKICLISGILLWVFGRQYSPSGILVVHIGASALSYGLTSYTLFAGFMFKKPILIIASLSNLFWTGSALIQGMMPLDSEISWEGHVCGAIAGLVVAYSQNQKMKLSMKSFHDLTGQNRA